jgi:uncharacterized protein (DUF58 family)
MSTTTGSSVPSHDRWIDMSAIMRMENLQWRAKSIVDGFHNGLHRSPKHGFSVEFSEYRPFSLGDDPRTIDWKLFARSDRYYIKKFEDETNRRCYLVVDQSKSMQYRSLDYSKLEYARTLAATLAYYWTLQRDAVGLVTFDAKLAEVLPARYRTGQLKRALTMLSRDASGESTNLVDPLRHLAELVTRRSLIVLVSDFLVDPASVRQAFAFLGARRHEILLMQVLDPAETEWKQEKPAMIRDIETGRELFVDPGTAAATYKKRFDLHQKQWQEMAAQLGLGWLSLRTDESIELALLDLLQRQQRAGGGPARGRTSATSFSGGSR